MKTYIWWCVVNVQGSKSSWIYLTALYTLLDHCDVTRYICVHAVYCCQNHLVANCFTHNLLSLKGLSQRRQDDDTLRKPRARTSVSSPPISLHSCQKELGASCIVFYCSRQSNWIVQCFSFWILHFRLMSIGDWVYFLYSSCQEISVIHNISATWNAEILMAQGMIMWSLYL